MVAAGTLAVIDSVDTLSLIERDLCLRVKDDSNYKVFVQTDNGQIALEEVI